MRTVCDATGKELAVVLYTKDYIQRENTRFFSAPEDTLQVGSLFFEPYSRVEPHRHKPKEVVTNPMEVIILLSGRANVDIYDEGKRVVGRVELKPGDVLVQKCGGHGFRFPAGTNMLEIKHGPYYGKESDKEMI